jgi:flagellar basal body-associated protein FliL
MHVKKKLMKKIIKISIVVLMLVVLFGFFFTYSGNAEQASKSTALLGSVLSVFTYGFLN